MQRQFSLPAAAFVFLALSTGALCAFLLAESLVEALLRTALGPMLVSVFLLPYHLLTRHRERQRYHPAETVGPRHSPATCSNVHLGVELTGTRLQNPNPQPMSTRSLQAALLFSLCLLTSCAGIASKPSADCTRTKLETPDPTSAVVSFTRPRGPTPSAIRVRFVWAPNTDPDQLYSPRGTMNEITISEDGRRVSLDSSAIRNDAKLRMIEDLWPELTKLVSARPGDYDLTLSYGVPAGAGGVQLEIRDYTLRSVTSWLNRSML
ncbi:MAG: hypothetical protein JSR82_06505 [Verrucomicrobia bacterium]|nr:hypothetical protein [Verrucomicrobiota bacterium]